MKLEFATPVVLLLAGVLYQFQPLLTRRGIFFSATVDPAFPRSSEGKRILRSFRWQVAFWTVAAALLALPTVPAHSWFAGFAPMLLLVAGEGLSYWRKFREVHARFGVRTPEIRQASVSASPNQDSFSVWFLLLPFLALAAVGVYLRLHLPQSIPTHWGISGQPDRWARDWGGAYWLLLFGTSMNVVLLALAWIVSRESRKTLARYVTVRGVQFLLYPLTLMFILMVLKPALHTPAWLAPGVVMVSVAGSFYWSYRKFSAPSAPDEVPEPQSDAYWKAGVFYWNPDDPAIFVVKRVGIGITMNFANKWSWIALLAIIVALLVPVFFLPD
jgi:uncharacterized membrane protein